MVQKKISRLFQKCENIDIPGGITSEAENIKPHQKAKKKITGTIMAVEIKKTYICINCKYKITDAPELNIIKCPNCNLKIKKCELVSSTRVLRQTSWYKTKVEKKMGRFFCTHAVLSELFQTIASAPGYNIDKHIDHLSATCLSTLTTYTRSSVFWE